MDKRKEKLLEELSLMQLTELLNLLQAGEATAAHHSVIRGILKDNGVELNKSHPEANKLNDLLGSISTNFNEFED